MDWMILWVVVLALAVLADFAVAKEAQKKGRSFLAFFVIGLFITPLVLWLVVASLTKDRTLEIDRSRPEFARLDGEEMVKCPECSEYIKAEARVCRYCHSDVRAQISELLAKRAGDEASRMAKQWDGRQERVDSWFQNWNNRRPLSLRKTKRVLIAAVMLASIALIFVAKNIENSPWEVNKRAWKAVINQCLQSLPPLGNSFVKFDDEQQLLVLNENTFDRQYAGVCIQSAIGGKALVDDDHASAHKLVATHGNGVTQFRSSFEPSSGFTVVSYSDSGQWSAPQDLAKLKSWQMAVTDCFHLAQMEPTGFEMFYTWRGYELDIFPKTGTSAGLFENYKRMGNLQISCISDYLIGSAIPADWKSFESLDTDPQVILQDYWGITFLSRSN